MHRLKYKMQNYQLLKKNQKEKNQMTLSTVVTSGTVQKVQSMEERTNNLSLLRWKTSRQNKYQGKKITKILLAIILGTVVYNFNSSTQEAEANC